MLLIAPIPTPCRIVLAAAILTAAGIADAQVIPRATIDPITGQEIPR